MLAIFQDGDEVLICEVDSEGQPKTADYFKKETGRVKEEMDLTLVEAPIMITRGVMQVEPERRLPDEEVVMTQHQQGTRVGAVLSSRNGVVEFLGYGIYNGDEVPPDDMRKFLGSEPNPKITLDNGDIVWGCECWWGPENEVKASLENQTVNIVKIADIR